jgi:hypothetical protein
MAYVLQLALPRVNSTLLDLEKKEKLIKNHTIEGPPRCRVDAYHDLDRFFAHLRIYGGQRTRDVSVYGIPKFY